jgi:acyl-CoA reductase-like NAD-dependent aldehyde dehydrogenase
MEGLEGTLAELRDTFKSGRTISVAWRKSQLRAMIEFVQDNEEEMFKVLDQDLGKHPVEAYRDEVIEYVNNSISSLNNPSLDREKDGEGYDLDSQYCCLDKICISSILL